MNALSWENECHYPEITSQWLQTCSSSLTLYKILRPNCNRGSLVYGSSSKPVATFWFYPSSCLSTKSEDPRCGSRPLLWFLCASSWIAPHLPPPRLNICAHTGESAEVNLVNLMSLIKLLDPDSSIKQDERYGENQGSIIMREGNSTGHIFTQLD